jgi:hypothetical protein
MDMLWANRCRCFRGLKGKGNALSERVVILGGDAALIWHRASRLRQWLRRAKGTARSTSLFPRIETI